MKQRRVLKLDIFTLILVFFLFFSLVIPENSPIHIPIIKHIFAPDFGMLLVSPILGLILFLLLTWALLYPDKCNYLINISGIEKRVYQIQQYYLLKIRLVSLTIFVLLQMVLLDFFEGAIMCIWGLLFYLLILFILFIRKIYKLKK